MFGFWSKKILIKRIKKRDLVVKDKLNLTIRAAEGVSKLVFYAQSTDAVISGRYSSGGKLLYLMAMKREEYINYGIRVFFHRDLTQSSTSLCWYSHANNPLAMIHHHAPPSSTGNTTLGVVFDSHDGRPLRLCGTPVQGSVWSVCVCVCVSMCVCVCGGGGYVYFLLFKNVIHLFLHV